MRSIDVPNFKVTGHIEDPDTIDYDILGFHKKRTIVKGELTKVEYFRNYDGTTYSDLVIEESRIFNRNINTGLVETRNMNIKWFLEDDSIGLEKDTVKYYSLVEAIDEGITRRGNMIAEAKLAILGTVGLSYGQDLLISVSNEINLFVNGTTQPLRDAVANSTKPYMVQPLKDYVVNILTF